jgi:phosphoribosylformylglycinamidine (FGAM) synthase-like amidotransferase family enzyme
MTITLLVECQPNGSAVNIFSLTGEDMAVSGLTGHRWKKGVHGGKLDKPPAWRKLLRATRREEEREEHIPA